MDKALSGRDKERTDLRVVKTRKAIQSAFERLLETTAYSEITVSAIAREACISRKTFYAHYSSVSDLLELVSQETIDEIAAEIQSESELLEVDEWVSQFTKATLAKLKDNPHLSGNVMRLMPAGSLVEVLRRPLEQLCKRELHKRGLIFEEGHEYVLSFFIGGLCTTYEAWLTRGQDAAALEEAATLISRAATQGIGILLKAV